MVNRITPENCHPEIDDDMKEWMELPNELDDREWVWDDNQK